MHIVHVITRLLRAGSEENTIATCKWQLAAGHRVSLIHGAEYDGVWNGLTADGISVIALPEMVHPINPLRDMAALRQLRQLYRALRPDVIHTHQSKAGILGRLASIAVPRALVIHGIHIVPFSGVSRARRQSYIAAEKLAARNTDMFIGVSEAVGRAYVDAGLARSDQMHCVRSGMEIEKFRQPSPPCDQESLMSGCKRIALMMAAFEPRKRHIEFLEAFSEASAHMSDIKLLLAGQGPGEQAVRHAVEMLGLQNKVVFCGHRPDPEALFALADVSVLTSEREGLPRVAVQSMAAGVPMVSTDLPGLDEVISNGTNGIVLSANDVAGAAAETVRLLNDPQRLRYLSTGAQNTDVSDWTLDALGRKTTALCTAALQMKSESSFCAVA